jgi:hypothetical protein
VLRISATYRLWNGWGEPFGQRRHVGQRRLALGAGHCQRPQPAAHEVRRGGGQAVGGEEELAAHQVGQRGAAAARLAKDPRWSGGHYHDRPGGVLATMTAVRALWGFLDGIA